ncbi:MAG: hypothetical protein KKE37_11595, partial [Verrucomicrobia bacterium]|nr:hypothetical protein [Verrucomicrobiota bacterium]MBU4289691.1 hypothetical protein [Verrucomicrobiota bacterium]MBU4429980.1 hypothetical protein [Verrucomicrobiota bacterium]
AMAIMFRERKESERRRASDAEMRKNTITDIQWSEASPDKKYLIVGYENPVVRSMKNASLFRLDTLTISHIVRTDSLVDVGWMNNSATLLILERYGKYSKKPSGILGALAGHPISIATYRLRAIDILSGSQTCEIVQTGVEQSIAEIRKNPIRSKNPSDGK